MPSPRSQAIPPKIFISYRRADSAAHAVRLYDQLAAHFGTRVVFTDIKSIEPGGDFVEAIVEAVGSCKILLAVIGREWLTAADERGRRLHDPKDFVRLEIAAALNRGIRVIPVLVQGAAMPLEENLPDELAPLARRQSWEVSDLRWNDDVRKLIRKIATDTKRRKPLPPPTTYNMGSPMASWVFGGLILAFLMLVVLVPVEPNKFPIIRFLMALSAAFFAIFFVGGVVLRGTLRGLIISASGGVALFVLIQFVFDPFKVLPRAGMYPAPAATASPTPTVTPSVTPTPVTPTPTPGGGGSGVRTNVTPRPTPTPKVTPTRTRRHPGGNRRPGGNCNAEDILLGRCERG